MNCESVVLLQDRPSSNKRLTSRYPPIHDVDVALFQSLPKADSNQRGYWLGRIQLSTKMDASEFVVIIGIMQSYCMVLINGGILRIRFSFAITPR